MDLENIQGSFNLIKWTLLGVFLVYFITILVGVGIAIIGGQDPNLEQTYIETSNMIFIVLKIIIGFLPIFILLKVFGIELSFKKLFSQS